MAAGLSQWLDMLCNFYANDLEALSDEALFASPGGKARSPRDFTGEVIGMNRWTTAVVAGNDNPPFSEDAIMTIATGLTTKAQMISEFRASCAEFKAALLAAPAERFNVIVKAPFGMEMPISVLANIFVNHIWYHDGQLNQVQCLCGDEQMHWM